MGRFSVSLDEERNEWVEGMADNRNESKTQVIQMLVEKASDDSLPAKRFPTNGDSTVTKLSKRKDRPLKTDFQM